MNPDMEGFYEVQTFQCFSCAALESQRARAKDHDTSFKPFVLDTRPPNDPPVEWVLELTPSTD